MRLKFSQIDYIAKHIVKSLRDKSLFNPAQNLESLTLIIQEVFKKNFEEEDRLNADAKKLLDQNKGKLGLNIDEEKAFGMIKRQLAKERNFVL